MCHRSCPESFSTAGEDAFSLSAKLFWVTWRNWFLRTVCKFLPRWCGIWLEDYPPVTVLPGQNFTRPSSGLSPFEASPKVHHTTRPASLISDVWEKRNMFFNAYCSAVLTFHYHKYISQIKLPVKRHRTRWLPLFFFCLLLVFFLVGIVFYFWFGNSPKKSLPFLLVFCVIFSPVPVEAYVCLCECVCACARCACDVKFSEYVSMVTTIPPILLLLWLLLILLYCGCYS